MECSICTSKCKPHIQCPYCPDSDSIVCRSCGKTYLFNNYNTPQCMLCKTPWSLAVIETVLGKKFSKKIMNMQIDDFKQSQYKKLETQKVNLPAYEEIYKLINQQKELGDKIIALEDQYETVYDTLDILRNKPILSPTIIIKCPKLKCNGVISPETETCVDCGIDVCMSCGKKIPFKRVHRCKKDDIATIKLLKENTKSCPKCSTGIYRSEGCPQMFCTICHTAFDWNTLQIIKGAIHNPHYLELVLKGEIKEATEGITLSIFYRNSLKTLYPSKYSIYITAFFQMHNEEQDIEFTESSNDESDNNSSSESYIDDYLLNFSNVQSNERELDKPRANFLVGNITRDKLDNILTKAAKEYQKEKLDTEYNETLKLISDNVINTIYKMLLRMITKTKLWIKESEKKDPDSKSISSFYDALINFLVQYEDIAIFHKYTEKSFKILKKNVEKVNELGREYLRDAEIYEVCTYPYPFARFYTLINGDE